MLECGHSPCPNVKRAPFSFTSLIAVRLHECGEQIDDRPAGRPEAKFKQLKITLAAHKAHPGHD